MTLANSHWPLWFFYLCTFYMKAGYLPDSAKKLNANVISAFFINFSVSLIIKASEVAKRHCPAKRLWTF